MKDILIGKGIEYIEINGAYWFKASEISELINIKNIRQSISRLRKGKCSKFKNCEIDIIKNKNIGKPLNNRGENFINLDAIVEIISNSRSVESMLISKELGISKFEHKLKPRETVFINNLKRSIELYKEGFKHSNGLELSKYKCINDMFEFEVQFQVEKYRLDIFFYNADIVVEYDERDHIFKREEDFKRAKNVERIMKDRYEKEMGYLGSTDVLTWIRVDEGKEIEGIIRILGAIEGRIQY